MSDSEMNRGKSTEAASSVDLSKIPLWEIIRRLNTAQVYAVILFAVGIFVAGFGLGERLSSANYDRELSEKSANYDRELTRKDTALRDIQSALAEAKQTSEDAVRVAAAADHNARAYRAKAEFLNRYLSYLQDDTPNGAMEKLFADHVCVLWRETQRDILSIKSDVLTMQDLEGDRPLSPAAIRALAAIGIETSAIDEYRQLDRRRSVIQPRADRFPVPQNADFERLQNLERRLQGSIQKGVTTKTVTFFDGSHYDIPQTIAAQVHFRDDCKTRN